MARMITDACVGCGTCEGVCPVSAISGTDDGKYVVDENVCIDCGACEAECPNEAIKEA